MKYSDKLEEFKGKRCALEHDKDGVVYGTVSDLSKDGCLFIVEETGGVPLIPWDSVKSLKESKAK